MNCPKCGFDVDEKMLACPNCKKILKLVCPECNTINKTNTCKKCGFVIISKCHQCGKINQTKQGTCSKCGFSTYTSVAINSSNIDEFACITMNFPNLDQVKVALGSTKLAEKFRANLDNMILSFAQSLGLTRQIIDEGYIIRFNKDDSYKNSALSAIKGAIELANKITELNFKMDKSKNFTLRCDIAVLKRDINAKPGEYKSGLNVKVIQQNTACKKLLNNLQIVTDSNIYEVISDKFSLTSLTSAMVGNQFVMFFELTLPKYISIPVEKPKEEEEVVKLPSFDSAALENAIEQEEDSIYNVEAINFEAIKCDFSKIESINLVDEVTNKLAREPKSLISIKSEPKYFPRSKDLIEKIKETRAFQNVIHVTCFNEMKYKPYGFFHELISGLYDYATSPKLFARNNFSQFGAIDPSGYIKDLISLNQREFPHPEDVRYSYFDLFFNLLANMPKTAIYVENIDKIDDTSLEILHMFFEKFNELNLSWILIGDKEFSLHKTCHFLLSENYYSEITTKFTQFSDLIKKQATVLKPIMDSYYLKKIAQNSKGSTLYFHLALSYLLEMGLINFENDSYSSQKFENVLIPPSIDELVAKRLFLLEKRDIEAFKALSALIIMGPRTDFETIKLLGTINDKIIKKLSTFGYLYVQNNSIYIQNYNLYRKNIFSNADLNLKQELAAALLEKAFGAEKMTPTDAILFGILEKQKNEFVAWEKLSLVNNSLGDFSSYLNCSVKFLNLLDSNIDETSQKTIEEYKMEVYENLSDLLYKYTPDKIRNIAQSILENLENSTDDKKIITLCNKMVQGCLISGNYSQALALIHKMLSRFQNVSINPLAENFNVSYFLVSLIKVEVLFSIGHFQDCIEAADDILDVISAKNLAGIKPQGLSDKQFIEVITDALGFAAFSRAFLLKKDIENFVQTVREKLQIPLKTFDLFAVLEQKLYGEQISLGKIQPEDDKFSKIIYFLLRAFETQDYRQFAAEVYQAKVSAKINKLYQFELLCDLLIGYSYFMLNEDKKASAIYHSVISSSHENGLKGVTYVGWYLLALMKFMQGEIDIAQGIANNACIQLEKDSNAVEYLLLLFKLLMGKILNTKGEENSAQLCFNHAIFIKDKYGLNFNTED